MVSIIFKHSTLREDYPVLVDILILGGCRLRLSPTVPSKPFSTLYIEKIPFSITPAAFSKWSSKIENATGFLYI
jgi:hypothetical protein